MNELNLQRKLVERPSSPSRKRFHPPTSASRLLHLALTVKLPSALAALGCPQPYFDGFNPALVFKNPEYWCNPEPRMTWVAEEGQVLSSGILV